MFDTMNANRPTRGSCWAISSERSSERAGLRNVAQPALMINS